MVTPTIADNKYLALIADLKTNAAKAVGDASAPTLTTHLTALENIIQKAGLTEAETGALLSIDPSKLKDAPSIIAAANATNAGLAGKLTTSAAAISSDVATLITPTTNNGVTSTPYGSLRSEFFVKNSGRVKAALGQGGLDTYNAILPDAAPAAPAPAAGAGVTTPSAPEEGADLGGMLGGAWDWMTHNPTKTVSKISFAAGLFLLAKGNVMMGIMLILGGLLAEGLMSHPGKVRNSENPRIPGDDSNSQDQIPGRVNPNEVEVKRQGQHGGAILFGAAPGR